MLTIQCAILRHRIVDWFQQLLGHVPAAEKMRERLTTRLSSDVERLLQAIEQWALKRASVHLMQDRGLAYKMDELEWANRRIEQIAEQVIVCRQAAQLLGAQLESLQSLCVRSADIALQSGALERARGQSRKLSEITEQIGRISAVGAPYDVMTLDSMAQAIGVAIEQQHPNDGLVQAQAVLREFRSKLFNLFIALCSDEARNRSKLMQIKRPIAVAMLSRLPRSVRKDAEKRVIACMTSGSGDKIEHWPI